MEVVQQMKGSVAMDIREFMTQMSEDITARPLPEFKNTSELRKWQQLKKAEYIQALGINEYLNQPRTPLNIKVTGTLDRQDMKIEKLYYESLPGLYVTAHLYIPKNMVKPAPAVLYLCGHSGRQKMHYQPHCRTFAKLGFVTIVIDTIQFGEVRGVHHGTFKHGWFHWISKGYTPAAVEVWNGMRAIDLLCDRTDVDSSRIGVTGQSGGGSLSWWTAIADDRIKVLAPSCGTGTIASHIKERTIDTHCDCVHPNNPKGSSLIELCALAAPRPCLIASPDQDKHFQIDSVREVYNRLKPIYKATGQESYIDMVEFPGPHGYGAPSIDRIFKWFITHLQGKDPVGLPTYELSDEIESDESLSVHQGHPPMNDESTTVQDWFIPLRDHSLDIQPEQLNQQREALVTQLKSETFSFFPEQRSLDLQIHQKYLFKKESWHAKFSYLTEYNWRLRGEIEGKQEYQEQLKDKPATTVIYVRHPDEKDDLCAPWLDSLEPSWLKVRIDPRGTGDTVWGKELDWHIRRALLLCGRTIASMRVLDILQAIEAVRSMPEVDESRIILAARDEMTVAAIYAALIDGSIKTLILKHPPATLDAPDAEMGKATHVELINALRYTDLPHTLSMLWPSDIVFVEERPDSYRAAEKMYRHLNKAGSIWRVPALEYWNPNPFLREK
jgi:cephalosporin-C deacetylase-like acetyl esterase